VYCDDTATMADATIMTDRKPDWTLLSDIKENHELTRADEHLILNKLPLIDRRVEEAPNL
jgi:hypothetical protein